MDRILDVWSGDGEDDVVDVCSEGESPFREREALQDLEPLQRRAVRPAATPAPPATVRMLASGQVTDIYLESAI